MGGLGSPLTSSNIQYVLAFIVIVLAGVVGYLFRALVASQHGRLEDAKDMNEKVNAVLSSISQTVNMIYDKLRNGRR